MIAVINYVAPGKNRLGRLPLSQLVSIYVWESHVQIKMNYLPSTIFQKYGLS